MTLMWALIVIVGLIVLLLGSSVRVINQYQRGVVLRFGQLREAPARARAHPDRADRGPPAQGQHADRHDAGARPGRHHPRQRHRPGRRGRLLPRHSTRSRSWSTCRTTTPPSRQVAQASLRSIIGKSDLDDLLSNRERLNQGLELMIDSPALVWGVQIDRVEIKDVALPETMKRSMSRQAEAERERRSRVITADGELQASRKLAAGRRDHGRTPGRAAAAPAADRRRGRRREELHPRPALPGRAAALPGALHAWSAAVPPPGAAPPIPPALRRRSRRRRASNGHEPLVDDSTPATRPEPA